MVKRMSVAWQGNANEYKWPSTEIDRQAFQMATEELCGNGLPVEALTRFIIRRAQEIKTELLANVRKNGERNQ
jgi:hypothetical protein